jgi:hypothetical protein
MEPMGRCPEKAVNNYHTTSHNIRKSADLEVILAHAIKARGAEV